MNIREGNLFLDDINLERFLAKDNSPCFIFLKNKIKDNIIQIQKIFNSVFEKNQGFYSTKSNYLNPIIQIVKDLDFGAEIISDFELDILNILNFPKNKVIAGGPYLPDKFLRNIVENNVPYLVIYHLSDIIRLQQVLEENNISEQKVLIRFRSPKYEARHGIEFSKEKISELESVLKKTPRVIFIGILSHFGTRLKDEKNYKQNFEYVIEILNEIRKNTSLVPTVIDIGGGFPHADSLKPKKLHNILEKMKELLHQSDWYNLEVFYEPGRYLVSDTGFCAVKIFNIDRDKNTIYVNIGNNYIPKFMKSSLRFYNVSKISENPNTPVDIYGYIPSDQDILIRNYNFTPNYEIGDFVLIANVGAYALTWSTRFPYYKPKVFFIDKNKIFDDM